MNFFIGDSNTLTGFTQVTSRLFLDQGWENLGDIWYKGYSTDCTISERLDDIINGYKPAGKWCVIQDEKIFHPVLRGFPLHHYEDNVTTLKLPNFQPKMYDTLSAPTISENEILTVEEAAFLIGDILVENTENFYKYNNPNNLTLYISAGLDTQTCWAVQDQVNTDYTLRANINSGFKFNPEYRNDLVNSLSQNYWGYKQITVEQDKSWKTSGFYAEVYTYRDIAAAIGYANYLGKTTLDELVTENDYYYGFITRPKPVHAFNTLKSQVDASTPKKLKEHLWNTIWYDHQMWHLDNNMFFCPFADLRIPEIALRLSIDDLIKCGVNGDIQRHIINRFAPERIGLISKYKNTGDVWYNFKKNFKRSMIGKDTNFIVL
jgi:hypothetical protein